MKNNIKNNIKTFLVGLIFSSFLGFLLYLDFCIFNYHVFLPVLLLIIVLTFCVFGVYTIGWVVMDAFKAIKKAVIEFKIKISK